jgi:hypothetical protein
VFHIPILRGTLCQVAIVSSSGRLILKVEQNLLAVCDCSTESVLFTEQAVNDLLCSVANDAAGAAIALCHR